MTIIDLNTSGDLREFTLEVSAHEDISRGELGLRPTLIQARAARTPDGFTSADTRVLNEELTWTTILSFADDLVSLPDAQPDEEFSVALTRYGQELIDRTVRIISL